MKPNLQRPKRLNTALSHQRLFKKNRAWQGNDMAAISKDHRDPQDFVDNIKDIGFAEMSEIAYNNPSGYATRYNPATGEKEMFVAGTRDTGQWLLNALDGGIRFAEDHLGLVVDKGANTLVNYILGTDDVDVSAIRPDLSGIDMWRNYSQDYYASVAQTEDPDIVYGHSRGAALVADMDPRWFYRKGEFMPKYKKPRYKKIGLDGAMGLAQNKDILNLNQKQLFDAAIGHGGKNNYTTKTGKTFHSIWT